MKKIAKARPAAAAKSLATIKAIIAGNRAANRETYAGLESSEIGEFNRSIMFGDNDEAFPSRDEWSRIVD